MGDLGEIRTESQGKINYLPASIKPPQENQPTTLLPNPPVIHNKTLLLPKLKVVD